MVSVDLVHDFLVLSRAESTWKLYTAWWEVYEMFCADAEVAVIGQNKAELLRVLVESLAELGTEYAKGTMDVYVAAVAQRFRLWGWGPVRQEPMVKEVLKGIERWWGKDVRKVAPVEPEHVSHLLQMEAPDGWRGEVWQHAVSMITTMWIVGMRPKETRYMSACDIRWEEQGAEMAVNRTKNDQEGVKRTSGVEFAEDAGRCVLRYLRSYMRESGRLHRCEGCTQDSHPTLECRACPRLWENMLGTGGVRNDGVMWGLPEYRVNHIVKEVYKELAKARVVPVDGLEGYTARSCRAGAVSAAAAGGVRRQVAADHLRMKSEMTLGKYDRALGKEHGAASRAMLQQL